MTYQTTITKKGQITIPKPLRDFLRLDTSSKIILEPLNDYKVIIKTVPDILDIAGKFKTKKPESALKTRDAFEKKYKRV